MSDPFNPNCSIPTVAGLSPEQSLLYTSTDLFGPCISFMLLGFIIMQTYDYYALSKNDSLLFKLFVYGIVLLQMFETAIELYTSYIQVAFGWGNPLVFAFTLADIFGNLFPLIISITEFAVQCFYIWRIWSFLNAFGESSLRTPMRAVCVFMIVLMLAALGSGASFAIAGDVATVYPKWFQKVMLFWAASSAVTDLLIAGCMFLLLRQAKVQTYYTDTIDRLSRVVRITIQTGFFTALVAFINVPLIAHISQLNGIFALPWFFLGKSYTISLFTNLNARSSVNAGFVNGQKIVSPQLLSTMGFTPGQCKTCGGTSHTNGHSTFLGSLTHRITGNNRHGVFSVVQAPGIAETSEDSGNGNSSINEVSKV